MKNHLVHVQGPVSVDCARGEFVVLSCFRNAELWIRSFFEHHDRLGAKHYFLLDNGSSDSTLEYLRTRKNVSVFECSLPFDTYYSAFYLFLLWNFGRSRWSLFIDQDHRFDYAGSAHFSVRDMLEYLDERRFTAVRTHIIDMFSDRPLHELKSRPEDDLKTKYPFCDLSDLWAIPDPSGDLNSGPGNSLHYLCGGIRKSVFGTERVYLTAHVLTFDGPSICHPNGHDVVGACIADFTSMVWHYKFLENFSQYQNDYLNRWSSELDSPCTRAIFSETSAYVRKLAQNPTLNIASGRPFVAPGSADTLLSMGILKASDAYLRAVSSSAAKGGS